MATNWEYHTDDILANRADIIGLDNCEPAPANEPDNRVIREFQYGAGQPDGLTVRYVLTLAYGLEWEKHVKFMNVADVATRSWYNYVTRPGKTYPDMVWDECDVIVLHPTMGRDLHGYEDTVGVANYRVLRDNWEDCEGLTDGPYSGSSHIALDLDKPAPVDLIDVLERLESYPVLDDDEHSQVEMEMIDEHWEFYGKRDTLNAVADALGVDVLDLTDYAGDTVTQLTFGGYFDYGCGGGYPSIIDVSACDFGTDTVAEWVKANVADNRVNVRLSPESTVVTDGYRSLQVDTRLVAWVTG